MKFIKLIISIIILFVLIFNNNFNFHEFRNFDIELALYILILGIFSQIVGSFRLFVLLKNFNLNTNFKTCIKYSFIGSFFDLGLPTSNGGDLIKASYFIKRLKKNKTKIFTGIFLDRALGFFTLFIVSLMSGLFINQFEIIRIINLYILFITVLLLSIFIILGSRRLIKILAKNEIFHKLRIIAILDAIVYLRNSFKLILSLFCITLFSHFLQLCSLYLIIINYNHMIGFNIFEFTYSSSISMLSTVFGISGGIGVGTISFVKLYDLILNLKFVFEIALAFHFYQTIVRLIGLPLFILEKKSTNY